MDAYRESYGADRHAIHSAIGNIGHRLGIAESIQRTQAERIDGVVNRIHKLAQPAPTPAPAKRKR